MIRHLVREGLWPLPSVDDIRSSVSDLSDVVDQIGAKVKRRVIDRCRCDLRRPRGLGVDCLIELREDICFRFYAHFKARDTAEAS